MRCNLIAKEELLKAVVDVENLEVQFGEKKIIHNVSFKVKA